MFYFKANLSSEPEKLIRHFSVTNEYYRTAFKTLYDRYGNKRLLLATLVNNLLEHPTNNLESTAHAIKAIHDTTKECLLGLENLDVSTGDWDPISLHLLTKTLGKAPHMLYEQWLKNSRELQTIEEFLEFLETLEPRHFNPQH